jgi:hypothetical protein
MKRFVVVAITGFLTGGCTSPQPAPDSFQAKYDALLNELSQPPPDAPPWIPTTDYPEGIIESAHRIFSEYLKTPSVATFGGEVVSARKAWTNVPTTSYQVEGYVDSQNSYGAMLRRKYIVIFLNPKLSRGAVKFYDENGKFEDVAAFGAKE